MTWKNWQQFREAAYKLLGTGKDAVMDLMDAVLVTRSVHSFAELSMSPVFRRKWPSLYEALEDCSPQRRGLMKLYIKELPKNERIILAGDHTAYPRLYADTLKPTFRTLSVTTSQKRKEPESKYLSRGVSWRQAAAN